MIVSPLLSQAPKYIWVAMYRKKVYQITEANQFTMIFAFSSKELGEEFFKLQKRPRIVFKQEKFENFLALVYPLVEKESLDFAILDGDITALSKKAQEYRIQDESLILVKKRG